MEKQFITALLVLLLVAPQTVLEAKSRHHGVKDRDHDAQERDRSSRYSRYKKYIKKYRHSHATKVEMELLKQAIADLDAKMDALEPQGQLPAELAAELVALQAAVVTNSGAIDANSSDISLALSDIVNILMEIEKIGDNAADIDELKTAAADLSTRLGALELIVDDHESRIFALENPDIPFSGASFSGVFMGEMAPSAGIVTAWNLFTGTAIGMSTPFSSIEIRSSSNGGATINASAICNDMTSATQIATALSTSTETSLVCGGRIWSVSNGGASGVELRAGLDEGVTGFLCLPNAIVIRPLINSKFWGGAGLTPASFGPTCGEPNQTLEVILTN